jgi:quercetin dioxygenase-like cupin family protein
MSNRTIVHPVRDEKMTFLETSAETGGEYTLVEVDLGPGKAAPAHKHKEQSERFEVISGSLDVTVEGETTPLEPGQVATAPGGSLHAFDNSGSERSVYRVKITPGNEGWERMMRCSFGLVGDGETWGDFPKSFTTIAVLATWGEAALPGPFSLLGPVRRWRAKSDAGVKRGEELLRRYG